MFHSFWWTNIMQRLAKTAANGYVYHLIIQGRISESSLDDVALLKLSEMKVLFSVEKITCSHDSISAQSFN